MFGVYFLPHTGDPVIDKDIRDDGPIISKFKTDIEAAQFALSLHQVCNVPHAISVRNMDTNDIICHFFVPKEDK